MNPRPILGTTLIFVLGGIIHNKKMGLYYMTTLNIRAIQILLDTNIPGKEIIPLTKSVLYQPKMTEGSGWNSLPYFTLDADYPESYLSGLNYEQQMEFFFNKKKMEEILKGPVIEPTSTPGINMFITQAPEKQEEMKKQEEVKRQEEVKDEQVTEKNEQITMNNDNQIKALEEEKTTEINTDTTKAVETKTLESTSGVSGLTFNGEKYELNQKEWLVNGKPVTSMDDYVTNKKEEVNTDVERVKGLTEGLKNTTFQEIFQPASDFAYEGGNKGWLGINISGFGFQQSEHNKNAIDEDGLFKESFCKEILDEKDETKQKDKLNKSLFQNLPPAATFSWDPGYRTMLTDSIQRLLQIQASEPLKKLADKLAAFPKYTTESADRAENQKVMLQQLLELRKFFTDMSGEFQFPLTEYPAKIEASLSSATTTLGTEQKQSGELNAQPVIGGKKRIRKGGGEDTEETEEKPERGEKNIMIMLRLMFPTKYPLSGNVLSSFHSVITGKNDFHLKWTDFLPGFFKKMAFEGMAEYSYIKVDGQTYTVTQAIWLNDIFNHTSYKGLIKEYEELSRWKDKELQKALPELKKKQEVFRRTFSTDPFQFTEADIKSINKLQIANKTMTTKLVADIRQFKRQLENTIPNYKSVIESGIKVTKTLQEAQKARWFKPENEEKINKIIRKMVAEVEILKNETYLFEHYLKAPGVNMDYETDPSRSIIEQKYPMYVKLIEKIRTFRAPTIESSNSFLQNSINDFLNNTELFKGVFNFLMNPMNIKKNPFVDLIAKSGDIKEGTDLQTEAEQYQNRFNTGVTIRPSAEKGQPYYEIYVQLNLIGGEINDKNKAAIDCMYQGDSLGDRLARLMNEALLNPWKLNSSRIFFDITTGAAKDAIFAQTKKETGTPAGPAAEGPAAESQEEPPTESKGGAARKKTRKYRQQYLYTRRRR